MPIYHEDYDKITNFYLEAARGNIIDTDTLHIFGYAPDVDTTDIGATIWDGCAADLAGAKISTYTYSDTADITDIASSDDSDTEEIEVLGLDENWDHVTQTVTLTGQTVATLTTSLIRVFRLTNVGTSDLVGTIYLTTGGAARTAGVPSVGTTVRGIIRGSRNQSQMAMYTTPANHKTYITFAWSTLAKTAPASPAAAKLIIKERRFGGVFLRVHTLNLVSNGSSSDRRPYTVPFLLAPKSDLEYAVQEVTANDLGITSGFHAVRIEGD